LKSSVTLIEHGRARQDKETNSSAALDPEPMSLLHSEGNFSSFHLYVLEANTCTRSVTSFFKIEATQSFKGYFVAFPLDEIPMIKKAFDDGYWENGDLEDDAIVSKEGEDTARATEGASANHEAKNQQLSCPWKSWEFACANCCSVGTLCFLFFLGEGSLALRNFLAMVTVVNYGIYFLEAWKNHQRSQERHSVHSYIELVKPKFEMAPLINQASHESGTENGEVGGNFVVVQ
jgi:hypothetical protein